MHVSSDTPSPSPRTVLVTGVTSGLGRECARALVDTGPEWHVMITSRSRERAEDAVCDLQQDVAAGRGCSQALLATRKAGGV